MPARKHESIAPHGDNCIRREDKGRITGPGDVGRSLVRDMRTTARAIVEPAQGDQGDGNR